MPSQDWRMADEGHCVRESAIMATDDRSLNALIVPALERCLLQIAVDQGCTVDELSFRLYRALEAYGLECIRAVEQHRRVADEERVSRSGVMRRVDVGIDQAKPRKRSAAK